MKRCLTPLLIAGAVLAVPTTAAAHPGGTDGGGGHYCRTNCASWGYSTGQYHYHGGSSTPAPTRTPARKTCGTGYRRATIEGKVKCLRRGQYCALRHTRVYKAHGFRCRNGRLRYRS